jgi:hypothetical protein
MGVASGIDDWVSANIQVEFSLLNHMIFIPLMGMRGLSNPTRCSQLSNAVLTIGLFCRYTKSDRITENVASLGLLLKRPNI